MIQNSIKVFRAKHDMTQEELAHRVGVTRQTILAMEKNKYVPSLSLAFSIARVFGVSITDIFAYKKEGENYEK